MNLGLRKAAECLKFISGINVSPATKSSYYLFCTANSNTTTKSYNTFTTNYTINNKFPTSF